MTTSNSSATPRPPMAGTVHANIQLPEHLHQQMKTIRAARHRLEGSDVKLSRIYREAVELYIQAEPQQALLNGKRHLLRKGA